MKRRGDLIGIKQSLARLGELGIIGGQEQVKHWLGELSKRMGRPVREWREWDRSWGESSYRAFKPIPCPFRTCELDFQGPVGFHIVAGEGGRFYLYLDELNLTLAGSSNWGTGVAGYSWLEVGMTDWRGFTAGLERVISDRDRV